MFSRVCTGKPYFSRGLGSETHNNRQVAQHGCLPSLLGDGDKGIEMVYGEEKNILYWVIIAAKAEQKSFLPTRQAQRTNRESTPFICSFSVPIHLTFKSQQWPPLSLSSLSDWAPGSFLRPLVFKVF
jgi:hypothetical protein